MFLVLVCPLFSRPDQVAKVRQMATDKNYRLCHATASTFIQSLGQLEADPELFFFKGQCGYQIGKLDDSVKDLSRFITARRGKSDDLIKRAFLIRGQAHLQLGLLDDASNDAKQSGNRTLAAQIVEIQKLVKDAQSLESRNKHAQAIEIYNKIRKICNSSISFTTRAASCAWSAGLYDQFIGLSTAGMQISAKNPELLELRGRYFFCDGDDLSALRHFRSCLAVASDLKNCTLLQRTVGTFVDDRKKIQSLIAAKKFADAERIITNCEAIVGKLCPANSKVVGIVNSLAIKAFHAQGKSAPALDKLNKLLKISPNRTELLFERAALLEKADDLDGAMRDYQTIRRVEPRNRRAEEAIQRISKQQEKEKNVNFYEVLGVKKDCSAAEIKNAYRAQARKWHPDRFPDPTQKRNAEKKMRNLNRAHDVLSDPQKRRLYDQGIDPDSGMPYGGGPAGGDGFQRTGGQQQRRGRYSNFRGFNGGNPFQFFQGGGQGFNFHFG